MPLKPNPELECLYHPYTFTGDIARARRSAHWAINSQFLAPGQELNLRLPSPYKGGRNFRKPLTKIAFSGVGVG